MELSKVTLQSGVSSLSVEGQEDFIREILALWDPLIKIAPTGDTPVQSQVQKAITPAVLPEPQNADGASQYENVYDQLDGKLKIIATLPGSSKADKTRNVAVILAFGYYLNGQDQIAADLVREACIDQACYDSSNFAQSFKSIKDKIVMNAKPGGAYELKLTAPGRKAAKELVEGLNQ